MNKFLKFLISLVVAAVVFVGALFAALPLPGHVPVLMYHFLGTDQDAKESKNHVSKKSFERHMAWIKWFGYRVISLEELYKIKTGEQEPRGREIAITFDDGNYTFASDAFPAIEKYAYPTTVFVVSESIKRKIHGSMTEDVIAGLLASASWLKLGGHSKTHPFLSESSDAQIEDELAGSKRDLEEMFGQPIDFVAYPFGDFDARVMRIAEASGYRLGFTTSPQKLKDISEGPFAMTRVKVTRSADNLFVFWFKSSGLYNFTKQLRFRLKT